MSRAVLAIWKTLTCDHDTNVVKTARSFRYDFIARRYTLQMMLHYQGFLKISERFSRGKPPNTVTEVSKLTQDSHSSSLTAKCLSLYVLTRSVDSLCFPDPDIGMVWLEPIHRRRTEDYWTDDKESKKQIGSQGTNSLTEAAAGMLISKSMRGALNTVSYLRTTIWPTQPTTFSEHWYQQKTRPTKHRDQATQFYTGSALSAAWTSTPPVIPLKFLRQLSTTSTSQHYFKQKWATGKYK